MVAAVYALQAGSLPLLACQLKRAITSFAACLEKGNAQPNLSGGTSGNKGAGYSLCQFGRHPATVILNGNGKCIRRPVFRNIQANVFRTRPDRVLHKIQNVEGYFLHCPLLSIANPNALPPSKASTMPCGVNSRQKSGCPSSRISPSWCASLERIHSFSNALWGRVL
ncbi:hypothetical protein SDC9_188025 [bioreactor metagenome]|uniref:Uncharacterized protein n=1 Tax=bioreactor metagenome TaxID=1076179 RepID=A0A645HNF6_9ZZZZ